MSERVTRSDRFVESRRHMMQTTIMRNSHRSFRIYSEHYRTIFSVLVIWITVLMTITSSYDQRQSSPQLPSSSSSTTLPPAIEGRSRRWAESSSSRRRQSSRPSRLSPVVDGEEHAGSRGHVRTRHERWADAAFDALQKTNCRQATFTTTARCEEIKNKNKNNFNVYIADERGTASRGSLVVTLPFEELIPSRNQHDAVIVLDPYPNANFGHLILIFYVETGSSAVSCRQQNGAYFVESVNDCLTMAAKKRCHNVVERRHRRRHFEQRCEINFLPLVYSRPRSSRDDIDDDIRDDGVVSVTSGPKAQLLKCRDDVTGFHRTCDPSLERAAGRETNGTGRLCSPLRDNSKRCETTNEVLQISSRCRWYETCDEAVIVSGGWNGWTERTYHRRNVVRVYRMLVENGYRRENIKIFHSSGGTLKLDSPLAEATHSRAEVEFFASSYKTVLRSHIKNLCSSPHCVDSLFVYLNNPSMSDGTMLLWDSNANGLVDEDEKYTAQELTSDLANCHARQVQVLVDQSHSGEIARLFRRSSLTSSSSASAQRSHSNVAVYASGRDVDYSYRDEFTTAWTRQNHTRKCTTEVFKDTKHSVRSSRPQLQRGEDATAVTIFGAPCGVEPPFTAEELRENYLGCQTIPAAVWAARLKLLDTPPPIPASGDYLVSHLVSTVSSTLPPATRKRLNEDQD